MAFDARYSIRDHLAHMTQQYQILKERALTKLREELSPIFQYHSFDHTTNMLKVVEQYTSPYEINKHEKELLKIAILYHDLGFIKDWKSHESTSVKLAQGDMTEVGYSAADIQLVKKLIMATRMPQEPESILEEIICDIDLDYLGCENYFERSELLFQEWLSLGLVQNRDEWKKKELDFLTNHHFHSEFGKAKRQPQLKRHLETILSKR